jgi:hypothetical protein
MSIKLIFQFGLALILLLFSAGVTWYEGSEVVDNSLEWKYSTPFTHLLNGGVEQSSDILPLDYFVYAAKFKPTYPILMLASVLYLLTISVYLLFKRNSKRFSYVICILGLVFLALSIGLYNSATTGANMFFNMFLVMGFLYIGLALIFFSSYLKGNFKNNRLFH